MKVTKRERKEIRRLDIQKAKAYRVEEAIIKASSEGAPPVLCPQSHHFSEGIYCRELFVPKGTTLTGVAHKISSFFVLLSGSMRVLWGNETIDIVAPALCENKPNTKNSAYMYEDCWLLGFTPNPDNLRDLHEVMAIYSETEPSEVQGMGNNKQEHAYLRAISYDN